jgi:amidohydrolase
MMKFNLMELTEIRKDLHKNPELSDKEKTTASRIKKIINEYNPDEVIDGLGGYGVAFIFKGSESGPSLLFRCELDALPINEINDFPHRSVVHGVSHKCGHDGHMTIMIGLAKRLYNEPPKKGKVILLFQPSEETGQGAKRVLEDPKFTFIKPEYVFALHNLPGYDLHKVIIIKGVFSSASIGLIIRITGKTSHAAEPEKGHNPAFAMATIIKAFEEYSQPGNDPDRIKIITPIHSRLGEKAFGTSPGYAEMMFTIRATVAKDFEDLKKYTSETIKKITSEKELHMDYEWVEEFPNTKNDLQCNSLVLEAAKLSGHTTELLTTPFRWSEDFGHFLEKYPGALFGLGSGINQPALHNPDYDFPDEIIESGISIFSNIYKLILQ